MLQQVGYAVGETLLARWVQKSRRSTQVDFDNYVLVFVKQRGVMHRPGDEAFPTGCRVLELEDVDDLRAESCGRSHATLKTSSNYSICAAA